MIQFPKAILGVPSILVIAFFFLPWLTISCDPTGGAGDMDVSEFEDTGNSAEFSFNMTGAVDLIEFSGFGLAMGEATFTNDYQMVAMMAETEDLPEFEGDFELWLVPSFAAFALAVLFVSNKLLRGLYTGSAVGALIVIALYYLELQDDLEATEATDFVTYNIWFWATIAVLVLMVLLGLVYRNAD